MGVNVSMQLPPDVNEQILHDHSYFTRTGCPVWFFQECAPAEDSDCASKHPTLPFPKVESASQLHSLY